MPPTAHCITLHAAQVVSQIPNAPYIPTPPVLTNAGYPLGRCALHALLHYVGGLESRFRTEWFNLALSIEFLGA